MASSSSAYGARPPPPPPAAASHPSLSRNNVILVHPAQRGNPVLQHVKNAAYEFSKDVVADYVMGSTCAVFVAVRYHLSYPKHADLRLREVGQKFRLRVLLVLVDDDNNLKALQELNKVCFTREATMILCWSNEECARYLETFKLYENKGAANIQEKAETEFVPQLNKVLTAVRSVNKTDVLTLLDTFGSLAGACHATEEQMVVGPGLGDKKVKRLHQALHAPFQPAAKRTQQPAKAPRFSSSSTSSSGVPLQYARHAAADAVDVPLPPGAPPLAAPVERKQRHITPIVPIVP